MKKSLAQQKHLIWLLSLWSLWFAAGCGRHKPELKSAKHIIAVETSPVQKRDISTAKTYSGALEGEEQANIVAKISERITALKARVGQTVRSGESVILLDKSGASSQYYQAEAAFSNAARNLERMKSLLAEGAIAQQMLDASQTSHDVAKANFAAARSAVELTTPIPGVVTALNVNLGDLSTPGAVLAVIARINRMKVIFNVNEADVTNLQIGQGVQVYSESRPDSRVTGQVVQIANSADVRSRTFEIKAVFPNTTDFWFKPGMFVKVKAVLSPRMQALVIPNLAVQSDGVNNRVFKVTGDRAIQQPVQLGVSDGLFTEVLQGLTEKDVVVTVGATNLRDSSMVRIIGKSN